MINRGEKGEEIAEKYLISLGYNILEQNYHSYGGEIDIICSKADTIYFVEVKNYKKDSLTSPYQAVNKAKQKKIIKTAKRYLMQNKLEDVGVQFDVIILESNQVKDHIEGAFLAS